MTVNEYYNWATFVREKIEEETEKLLKNNAFKKP